MRTTIIRPTTRVVVIVGVAVFVYLVVARVELSGAMPAQAPELEVVSHIGDAGTAIAAVGDYALVGLGARLVIFDISDPDGPVKLGESAAAPRSLTAVDVNGDIAYAAYEGGGT